MEYFSAPELSALNDLCVCGPLLFLDPQSICITDSEYTDKGVEFNYRCVEVKHNGTRMGFKLAFGIARQLLNSNRSRPALLSKWAIVQGELRIEIRGRPAFQIKEIDPGIHQDSNVTWTKAAPDSPSLPVYTGPTLALPASRKPFLP